MPADTAASKQPARPSNTPQAVTEYSWEGRVLDSNATPIPKVGNVFKPTTPDQIACLEHLVTAGIVKKTAP